MYRQLTNIIFKQINTSTITNSSYVALYVRARSCCACSQVTYALQKNAFSCLTVETQATFTSSVAYGYTNTCSSEWDVGISTNCTGEHGHSPPAPPSPSRLGEFYLSSHTPFYSILILDNILMMMTSTCIFDTRTVTQSCSV